MVELSSSRLSGNIEAGVAVLLWSRDNRQPLRVREQSRAPRAPRPLKSKPPDGEGLRKRVEAALCKYDLGEQLSRKELMIVQWVRYGGRCVSCASAVGSP